MIHSVKESLGRGESMSTIRSSKSFGLRCWKTVQCKVNAISMNDSVKISAAPLAIFRIVRRGPFDGEKIDHSIRDILSYFSIEKHFDSWIECRMVSNLKIEGSGYRNCAHVKKTFSAAYHFRGNLFEALVTYFIARL